MITSATELRARLGGRRPIVSVSGGKDSAAVSLWLKENQIEHWRVFANTGWEHPITYEYVRGPLTAALGPIFEVQGPRLMTDLIRHKGMFPSRTIRFCTVELKVKPLASFVRYVADALGQEVINVVGIRAEESDERALYPAWEWDATFDCEVHRPALAWTFDDVIAIHKRHGLTPNPLYLRGATRVGCYPCIHARKAEIKMIADSDPWRIDELRDLETEVTSLALSRYEAKGEELEHARTFFQNGKRTAENPGGYIPIDDVVRWSRTRRGGKVEDRRIEMFPGYDGCARWGMCESSAMTPEQRRRLAS